MPEIQIRPVVSADITSLVALEHDFTSEYVWQMEILAGEGRMEVNFRQIRLPRSVRVDYPRSPRSLTMDWERRSGILVAVLDGHPVGYAVIKLDPIQGTCWLTDLAVMRRLRRQGIGTALLFACEDWAAQRSSRYIIMEMQPKNDPAYSLAEKLGFEFCGYNDRYYANNDIALFFAKSVR
jgi:ribosomal protein S18 acetylase RimI-like enzyme